MEHIKDAILSHLEMDTKGALLITGHWGAGKTFYLKNFLFEELQNDEAVKYSPIMVSLYGENDIKSISNKIFNALIDKKGSGILKSSYILNKIKTVSKAIKALGNWVDPEEIINLITGGLFDLLKREKILLFFDDLERLGSGLKTDDFLGYVNELSENKECKVVIVANEQEIEYEFKFKEKTISKTILFSVNIEKVLANMIERYYQETTFYNYLKTNEKFLVRTLDPSFDPIVREFESLYKKELKEQLHNLRTVNAALEHFRIVFKLIDQQRNVSDDITKKILETIWCFILGIMVESIPPMNKLSFENRQELDKRESVIISDYKRYVEDNNKKTEPSLRPKIYRDEFKEKYYRRISQKFLFYAELYDFITAGKKINAKEFIIDISKKAESIREQLNPAYGVYNEFMELSPGEFSDEEFPQKLNELLSYTGKGVYTAYIQYLTNASSLFHYHQYFNPPKSIEEVRTILQEGVNIYAEKVSNDIHANGVHFYTEEKEEEENDPNVDRYALYIQGLIDANKKNMMKEEIMLIQEMMIEAPVKLKSRYSNFQFIGEPIFQYLDVSLVIQSMEHWQANDFIAVNDIFQKRYKNINYFKRKEAEFDFLLTFIGYVLEKDTTEKKYSNHVLEQRIKPSLKELKERIETQKEFDNKTV